jgi:hypothetical protein
MLITPLFLFFLLLVVVGTDTIASCGLYEGRTLCQSLGAFVASISEYTPQAVKANGGAGYLTLIGMLVMVVIFPKWVLTQYTKK